MLLERQKIDHFLQVYYSNQIGIWIMAPAMVYSHKHVVQSVSNSIPAENDRFF